MKILITGGAGYGGGNLSASLLRCGHSVKIMDILAPNEAWRIQEFIDHPKLEYVWKSVHDIKANDIENCNVVIHMAAQADVPMGFTSPVWTGWQETIGTISVLEACREIKLDKFILASTGNVIGRPLYIPIDEKHPVTPHNPYSACKANQECLVHAYRRSYKIPTAVMRNGIVYGPKMRKQIFIYIWLKNILNNKPIIIEGGEQTRDPCFGEDTVDAWIKAIESDNDKIIGQTFQISKGTEWKMRDIAELCMRVAKRTVPIIYTDYRPGEEGQRECFDNSFAKKILKYEPKTELEEGLEKTLMWIKSQ